jgi:hypothetical protein
MPSLQQVHVDQALTNISVAYRNAAFVAERVAPVVPVQKQTDVYFKFSKQHFRTFTDTYRPGTEANEVEVDLDARGTYRADGHAIQMAIPDELRENADPGANIDVEYTEKLTNIILLNQEVNLNALMTTSNLPNHATLSGTTKWSDYQNSDPVPVVDAAKETVQKVISEFPNCLLLPRPVFRVLRSHPRILDRLKYTGVGAKKMLDATDLAQVFDVDEVIVPAALSQQNPEGEADSLDYVWGNNALLFYRPARPGLRTPAFIYTFMWVGAGVSYQVKRWRVEGRDSELIKVKKYYDISIVSSGAAYLWVTPI